MSADKVTLAYLHPGTVTETFSTSKTDLLFCDAFGQQRIVSHQFGVMAQQCGSGGIVDGRNAIAAKLLDHSEADWLLMIDSDMGFDADLLERLMGAADADERPVVGALAFAVKTDGPGPHGAPRYRCQPTVYDLYEDETRVGFVPRFDYERDALVRTAATGAACVLIHRRVFAEIRDKYGPIWFDQVRHPKGPNFSEDLAFSIRVAACGFPMFVHTGIKTSHDKGVIVFDEEWFDAEQALKPLKAMKVPPAPPAPPEGRPSTSPPRNRAERRRKARAK